MSERKTASTVLTQVEQIPLQGKYGSYTLFKFLAENGLEITTSKKEIYQPAYNLLNLPVVVEYEESKKGEYTNYYLHSVRPADSSDVNVVKDNVNVVATNRVVTGPPTPTVKDRTIWRQTATKVAVEIVGWAQEEDRTFENVVVVADRLIRYYEGGSEALVSPGGS